MHSTSDVRHRGASKLFPFKERRALYNGVYNESIEGFSLEKPALVQHIGRNIALSDERLMPP
jgi:hypothetical protein